MVIVTGVPRSGTSMVMQTLFYLRFPVFGIPHPPNRESLMQVSEKPFWEHYETLNGDVSLLRGSDCAVKVELRKALKYVQLDSNVDKVILCERDINLLIKSQVTWNIARSSDRALKLITQSYEKFQGWIGETPSLVVNFDNAIINPHSTVAAIAAFVGTTLDQTDAINNIEVA